MHLEKTFIDGLFLLHRDLRTDHRGTFTRLFGSDELAACGLSLNALHVNTSTSTHSGTLRGIHFQYPPYCETKVVSCTCGSIFDIGVDLRVNSPTRYEWYGTTLTPENGLSMIIPDGFGHAFLTLEPNSTAVYVVSQIYKPDHESGLRYDDPRLSIQWPSSPSVVSPKDLSWDLIEKREPELNRRFSI